MRKVHPKDTTFIVSGLARSGTTYMMRCIKAGGIPIVSQSWRHEIRNQDARIVDFASYKGKCVKHFSYRLINYDTSKMAILFMKRDPYKIVASSIRFNSRVHPWIADVIRKAAVGWRVDVRPYEKKRAKCAAVWRKEARSYIECNLEDMDTVSKRLNFFRKLRDQGWPIDPKKAANVENDEKDRIKRRGRRVQWT